MFFLLLRWRGNSEGGSAGEILCLGVSEVGCFWTSLLRCCVCLLFFFSNPYSITTNYKNTFLCCFLLLYILSSGCFSQNVLDIECQNRRNLPCLVRDPYRFSTFYWERSIAQHINHNTHFLFRFFLGLVFGTFFDHLLGGGGGGSCPGHHPRPRPRACRQLTIYMVHLNTFDTVPDFK